MGRGDFQTCDRRFVRQNTHWESWRRRRPNLRRGRSMFTSRICSLPSKALKRLRPCGFGDHLHPYQPRVNIKSPLAMTTTESNTTHYVKRGRTLKYFHYESILQWSWLVLLAYFAANTVSTAEASSSFFGMYDRYCVGNFGCETDFQDMIFNVSLFINYDFEE